jgi:hypothetical protein
MGIANLTTMKKNRALLIKEPGIIQHIIQAGTDELKQEKGSLLILYMQERRAKMMSSNWGWL